MKVKGSSGLMTAEVAGPIRSNQNRQRCTALGNSRVVCGNHAGRSGTVSAPETGSMWGIRNTSFENKKGGSVQRE